MFDLNINSLTIFIKVKFLFIQVLLLQHFNPTLLLRLETDISVFTVETILLQLYQDR